MDAAAGESLREWRKKNKIKRQLAATGAARRNPAHHLPTTELAAPTLNASSGQAADEAGTV